MYKYYYSYCLSSLRKQYLRDSHMRKILSKIKAHLLHTALQILRQLLTHFVMVTPIGIFGYASKQVNVRSTPLIENVIPDEPNNPVLALSQFIGLIIVIVARACSVGTTPITSRCLANSDLLIIYIHSSSYSNIYSFTNCGLFI